MRISDRMTARNYLKYLDNAKTNYAKTNERIASGHRFERISDDVSAGTRVLRIRADKTKADEYSDNIKTLNEQLTSTEDALRAINDVLGKAHSQKVLKAMNEATGESGRETIANEISAMKDEILNFANSKHYNRYVLGGTSATTAPFTVNNDGNLMYNDIDVNYISKNSEGKYVYNYNDGTGDHVIPMDGDIFTDIGLGITMNGSEVSPSTAFKVSYSGMDVLGCGMDEDKNPKNVYNILNQIEKTIRANDIDKLGELDDLLVSETDKFRASLTNIGAKTNFLDSLQDKVNNEVDSFQRQVKNLMGVNDAEEATNQTMNDYVLKAVLRMGANVLPVSLMNFLN